MKRYHFLTAILLLAVLVLVRLQFGLLLFHTLAELFSVVVGIFMLVTMWSTYRFTRNDFLMFLGIGYFWIAILDSWHTFTFAGMPFIDPGHNEITIRFWVYTRLLEAAVLLVALLYLRRRLSIPRMFFGLGLVASVIVVLSTLVDRPVLLAADGLTAFKVGMEYTVIALLAIAFYVYRRQRNLFSRNVVNYLLVSIGLTILAELCFTVYESFDATAFVMGHLFKFVSFWMIYIAIIRTSLTQPFTVMASRSSSYDAIPDPALVVDNHGVIAQVNRAAEIYTGLAAEDMVHKPVHGLFHSRNLAAEDCELCQANREGRVISNRVIRAPVEQQWLLASLAPVMVGDSSGGMVQSFADITETKNLEESLRLSEERFRELVEDIPDLLYRTDRNGKITYMSQSVLTLAGFTAEEALGMDMSRDFYLHPERREDFLRELQAHGLVRNFEAQLKHKDGSLWWGSTNAHVLKSSDGDIVGVEGLIRDISEQKSVAEQLSYHASHDALTNLINRREFERRVEQLLAASDTRHNASHVLCFMDLDQFKIVNDTCGHIAGDEMLRQVSHLMRQSFRDSDMLARLGGDEFAVVLENCSMEKAHQVTSLLLGKIREYTFYWEKQRFNIGVSIGLVIIDAETQSLTELLKQADAACYMAKDLGRNRIQEYHEEDADIAQRKGEMQWVGRINRALEEDRFCIYAQPIVPLGNGSGLHYELLLRMRSESGEIIPPGEFLKAAERYKLMPKIDSWVVRHSFGFLAEHGEFLDSIDFVSINLSGPSLNDPDLLNQISEQFQKTSIPARKICFEVTETDAISNLNAAISFIQTLKIYGCRFALDDFGSGFSSFGYLKNLPVDYLKIDGIFVKDMVDDPIQHAMVKSINEIGHVMGMQTIAEFVENDEIKSMLVDLGVNFAQGYGVGRPEPIEDQLTRTTSQIG